MNSIALHRICIVLLLAGLTSLGWSYYNEVQQHAKDVTVLTSTNNDFVAYKDSVTGLKATQDQKEVSELVAKAETKKTGIKNITAIASAKLQVTEHNIIGNVKRDTIHDTIRNKPFLSLVAVDNYRKFYGRVLDTVFIIDTLTTILRPKFVFGDLPQKFLASIFVHPTKTVAYFDENPNVTVVGMNNMVVPYNPKWYQRKWIIYAAGIATTIIILKIDPG